MLNELTHFVEVMSVLLQVALAGVSILTLTHFGMLIHEEVVFAGGAFMLWFAIAVRAELKYQSFSRPTKAFFNRPKRIKAAKVDKSGYRGRHTMDGKLDDETIVGMYHTWRKKVAEDSTDFFHGMLVSQRKTAPLF